ncbi:Chloroperoxidase [Microdochium trichocladiopsis]|uniref:Chloroperoxidase n=1 Tax=Microdochium trichocladiopsis TaxID=1682393 RepID=A0A9P8YKT0_9PEZI|nr:Chloroperoxidase [Microdochium trichocladiopsis]KAH7040825.1 Chloroperoxidase [Microdochium trichocladiopsis]
MPVEVHGLHEFVPPDFSRGDQRGPCPGLNALANHGYINRKGVTSLAEVVPAINQVFGMGLDLGFLLATIGVVFTGNPLSLNPGFSIGDSSSASQNLLGNLFGLLGKPRGLSGSHNIIEADSSNTRNDLYLTGDASSLDMDVFRGFVDMLPEGSNLDIDAMAQRAENRFHESIASNPNFYYGPITGSMLRNAACAFTTRFFSNHSAENPGGFLDKKIAQSFLGVTEQNGVMTYQRGWERIPENWYRRPVDYSVLEMNLDLVGMMVKHPAIASIGGNMGKVNSFAAVDLSDISGGLLNTAMLLEDNNLLCFVFELVKTLAPNSLSSVFKLIDLPLQVLTSAINLRLLDLACPAFADLKKDGSGLDKIVENIDDFLHTLPGARGLN